jgi:predicted peptidase
MQTSQRLQRTVPRHYECRYLLHLPREAQAGGGGRRWPLLLFLHGMGERGTDLALVRKHGPPRIVEDRPDFPFIVVSPQCEPGDWWRNEPLAALLDEVVERHPVDASRICLTGLSMGGFATWNLLLEFPARFAAAAPICGGGNPYLPYSYEATRLQALKTLPIRVFHGARDPVVPLAESERMVLSLRKFGCPVDFTVYPEAEHDSWTATYDHPGLYDWFLSCRRAPGQ